jgi:hypothetical protein
MAEDAGQGGAAGAAGTGTPENTGSDDAIKRANFERDKALGDITKLRRELDALKSQVPTEDQRKRYAELETAAETAEEERKRKAGEFDQWRVQVEDKHGRALKAKDDAIAEAQTVAKARETELNNTLIGLAFAGAGEWFGAGPDAKNVLLPDIARAYFASHVEVEVDEQTGLRQVVVKDRHGARLVDVKTGKPLPFAKAIGELIESHPDKDHLLRGSGKVGSNSSGGTQAGHALDFGEIAKRAARGDKTAIEALKQRRAASGIVFGEAYQ